MVLPIAIRGKNGILAGRFVLTRGRCDGAERSLTGVGLAVRCRSQFYGTDLRHVLGHYGLLGPSNTDTKETERQQSRLQMQGLIVVGIDLDFIFVVLLHALDIEHVVVDIPRVGWSRRMHAQRVERGAVARHSEEKVPSVTLDHGDTALFSRQVSFT